MTLKRQVFAAGTIADLENTVLQALRFTIEELLPEMREIATTEEAQAVLDQMRLWQAAAEYLESWAAALSAEDVATAPRPRPLTRPQGASNHAGGPPPAIAGRAAGVDPGS